MTKHTDTNHHLLDPIEAAIEDFKQGKMVVVVDDEDRENEGDLIMAAQNASTSDINFMAKYGRGLICAPIEEGRAKELQLPLMVPPSSDGNGLSTPFSVSVDLKVGVSTGISCEDRAKTLRALAHEQYQAADFLRPGHIFPLIAKGGGVLERQGHTEASIDLCKLAGAFPAAVICEIMNDDGTMARLPQLKSFADKWNLKLISIQDLIKYRKKISTKTTLVNTTALPTKYGPCTLHAFEESTDPFQATLSSERPIHLALVKGTMSSENPVMVRVHSECLTGDLFGSLRCDCGEQLERSLQMFKDHDSAILIYLRQEGRGIGLANKLKAYNLQDLGHDTISANKALGLDVDMRSFQVAKDMLKQLGVKKIHLMTNNPQKIFDIHDDELQVVHRVPLETTPNAFNKKYLETKKRG